MPVPVPNPRLRVHVVHEDESLIVVNKMPGMVSEPGRSHARDSVLNALCGHDGGRLASRIARLGETRDWGLVHRLDRLTSGVLLVALDAGAYHGLRADFESRSVRKTYLAIVRGTIEAPVGEERTIEAPLAESRVGQTRVSVLDSNGRPSLTRYRLLERAGRYALVHCDLVTGRLHQIRVHLASIGAPVAGDPVYDAGGKARPQGRRPEDAFLGLHAWTIAFTHPITNRPLSLVAPPPRRFVEFAVDHGLHVPSAPPR